MSARAQPGMVVQTCMLDGCTRRHAHVSRTLLASKSATGAADAGRVVVSRSVGRFMHVTLVPIAVERPDARLSPHKA